MDGLVGSLLRAGERDEVLDQLKQDEGWRGNPYTDTLGNLTIGYGTKLPLSHEQGALLLDHEVDESIARVERKLRSLSKEPSLVPAGVVMVFVNMDFQMRDRFLEGFPLMWKAVARECWYEVARQILRSRYAKETPERAERNAAMVRLEAGGATT